MRGWCGWGEEELRGQWVFDECHAAFTCRGTEKDALYSGLEPIVVCGEKVEAPYTHPALDPRMQAAHTAGTHGKRPGGLQYRGLTAGAARANDTTSWRSCDLTRSRKKVWKKDLRCAGSTLERCGTRIAQRLAGSTSEKTLAPAALAPFSMEMERRSRWGGVLRSGGAGVRTCFYTGRALGAMLRSR